MDNIPEHIELIDERFTRDDAPEGFTGVGGVYNFTFKPRSIGEGAIHFKYDDTSMNLNKSIHFFQKAHHCYIISYCRHHRVWEKNVPPIDTAELKCTVLEED